MENLLALLVLATLVFGIYYLANRFNVDAEAQKSLDKYLNGPLTNLELGTLYERYIGYLYETDELHVQYHGAINGYADLGRDLIVRKGNDISIIQTKNWAYNKTIKEKDIFQLYGSMTHFKLTSKNKYRSVKAVFYTTAQYSKKTKEVARVLGVELRTEKLNKSYPMIKCNVSANGEKIYYLPFDIDYDKIKIEITQGSFFAKTVKEAVDKGFRRSGKYSNAA